MPQQKQKFAKPSFDVSEFEYHGTVPKFRTTKEMAGFMHDLYDNDHVVGIVNGLTYEFELRDTIYNYVASTR